MSERFEHATDLAVLSFDELHDQMCFAEGSLPDQNRGCTKPVDPGGHLIRGGVIKCATHGDDVPSHDRVRGIGQIVGELGVGGQEQQPGARHVKPANRDECSCFVAEHVEYRWPAFGIAPSGNDASRFVKRQCAPGATGWLRIINRNSGVFGGDKVPGVAHDATRDANASIRD